MRSGSFRGESCVLQGAEQGQRLLVLAAVFFGPGVGNAIGAGVGAVAGLAAWALGLDRLIDWVADTFWRSAAQVRERRRQKISDQLTMALRGMPSVLITSTQPGRSSAETKFRITWNSIQGGITHM